MKINGFIFIVFAFAFSCFASSNNLLESKIIKLTATKTSTYATEGIFSNGKGEMASAELKAIRHAFTEAEGYERLVFDFASDELPQIYGNISGKNKKIYLDLSNTILSSKIDSFGNSKFVESVDLFPITPELLSLEINLRDQLSVDVFYLKSPGRLVIDIR